MVIVIFGESCTGKSFLAHQLAEHFGSELFQGKDYLRLAKNQMQAETEFKQRLAAANTAAAEIIWVVAEIKLLELLPQESFRILMKADLDLIKERFSTRTQGIMSEAVAKMLERKQGMFDDEPADYTIYNNEFDFADLLEAIHAF